MTSCRSVVIVGGAAAGLATADALHRRGFGGVVTIVGDEAHPPCDRPPLSKQILAGEWDPERASLLPRRRLDALPAEIRSGVRAVSLDVERRTVGLDDGDAIAADAVVIATGVRPRELPGARPVGVHVLRTLEDAIGLRRELVPGARLVVVGGGFLGLETAATARKLGADVTVVEPTERPLVNRLGETAATRLIELHRARGVTVLAGIGVAGLVGDDHVTGVRLGDGTVLPADVVLVAIGSVPNVEWLEGSSLTLADGVACDERCTAAEGVWAAGDVARWHHVDLGVDLRLEHRQNAAEQGRHVAQGILGDRTPFTPVPFFWTDHHGVKIQLAGVAPAGATETVVESDEDRDRHVITFSRSGRLVGVLGWNAPDRVTHYRRELGTAAPGTRAGRESTNTLTIPSVTG